MTETGAVPGAGADPVTREMIIVGEQARFARGQRVRLSREGVLAGILKKIPDAQGMVTGFSRDGRCISVLRDRTKNASSYHVSFWEPIEDADSDLPSLRSAARTAPSSPSSTDAGGGLLPAHGAAAMGLTMYGHYGLTTKGWAERCGVPLRYAFEYEAKAALRDYPGEHMYVVREMPPHFA